MDVADADFLEEGRGGGHFHIEQPGGQFRFHANSVVGDVDADVRSLVSVNVNGNVSRRAFRFDAVENGVFHKRLQRKF